MRNQKTTHAARALLLAVVVAGAFGCAKPRVITAITAARDQVKFLYREGSDQGILKCKVAADGSLTACKHMPVVILDE